MRPGLAALLALAVLALPSAAVAARCAQTTIADLEDEVMCPVCAMPLGQAREAPQARRQRAFIARLIATCRSKDEIKAALVSEFGPAVLAEPARGGDAAVPRPPPCRHSATVTRNGSKPSSSACAERR
jgi:cytochrome c-type biogenesis protein CcmH/NrfF